VRPRFLLVVRTLMGTAYDVTLATLGDLERTMLTTDLSSLVRFLSRFDDLVVMNESVVIASFANMLLSDLNDAIEFFRNANGDEAMKPETSRELLHERRSSFCITFIIALKLLNVL
jgi:hypothetical protein